jgi:uncharacterized protein YndB with AHSA1/START domain
MTATATPGRDPQASEMCEVASVSRRIAAPADAIFAILADPRRHTEIDGSGMLRGAVTESVVSGVGDVFVLKMYYRELGDYEMANEVLEFEPGRRIIWEPRRNDIDEPSWRQRWGYVLTPDGDGATVVTEVFDGTRWPAENMKAIQYGRLWLDAMTRTLELLDGLFAG